MTDSGKTLLLTRPEAQSRAFLSGIETETRKPIRAVISPVMEIEPVGPAPDLADFDAVIVTSANAVRCLGADLAGRRVLTVGETTAALAREFGADARCLGADAEAFLRSWGSPTGRFLHARGGHVSTDLAARLRAFGASVEEKVVYDQVARPLTAEALCLLAGDGVVVAPLFSPRSAALLAAQGPFAASMVLVAISPATAAAWTGEGRIVVARHPDAEAVRDLVIQEL